MTDQPQIRTIGEPDDPDLQMALGLFAEPTPLEFTGLEEGWPPHPRSWQLDDTVVEVKPLLGAVTDSVERKLFAIARRNARVKEALGSRFAYITTYGVTNKDEPLTERPQRIVMFFSYDKNSTVNVYFQGTTVAHIDEQVGHHPPGGGEEIDAAIALARSDPTLAGKVGDLIAKAIVLPPTPEQVGYGRRTFWVTFSEPSTSDNRPPPRFSAVVDLGSQRVLATSAD